MGTLLANFGRRLAKAGLGLWQGLRSWSGDAAYDRYLKVQAKQGSGQRAISREQFYLEQLERRYSRPSRCC